MLPRRRGGGKRSAAAMALLPVMHGGRAASVPAAPKARQARNDGPGHMQRFRSVQVRARARLAQAVAGRREGGGLETHGRHGGNLWAGV